ncbi:NmrA family transcriptional regulator [Streptomyces sp. V3I7]|uniref:NmrA family transcriptional regulator n=1 Tax=Streptomyces sp. V3I7 TaxID=3042278 RepID=UPI002782C38C|nr:NmrA family transcriptional regulator [Streptomyces sp. V3I7]MDQ0993718.1 uncharacterized protein YbjT (DUF2867 family) [Streptomyces sp. V3I7]
MTWHTQHAQDTQGARNARRAGMTVVVTGASGRTGSRVAAAAEAAGLTVRPVSRARGFDWHDRSTWEHVLRDADAAYLVHPEVGAPDAALAVGLFAHEAVRLGVWRLVLLSTRGEASARPTEEALRESGADWTVVRASWFAQNFSEGPLMAELRERGELVFPGGEVREPFVDVRDVADVVVAVLTADDDRYVGQAVTVSGPRLLTFADAVAEIARAAGRELAYRPVSAREYGERLTGSGVPAEEAEFVADLFESLLDGRNAYLSDGVRQVLGREPRDFRDYVREAAAAGAWTS